MTNRHTYCYFTVAYLPPIEYFIKIFQCEKIYLECHENFIKQTYRNRCTIYGANGRQTLSIPVSKKNRTSVKIKITDVEIDYQTDDWQKNHLKSIESAYRHTPFFDYYYDDIRHHILYGYNKLADLNINLLKTLLTQLQIQREIMFTGSFHRSYPENDFRYTMHPKKPDVTFNNQLKSYYQIFAEKHGFIPNLSVLDLIFHLGPEANHYLLHYCYE